MIRRKSEGIFFAEKLTDQVLVYLCWMTAYFIRFEQMEDAQAGLLSWYLQYGLLLVLLSVYFFKNSKLYINDHITSLPKQIITQIKANAISLIVFVVFMFFLSQHRVSRLMLLSYFIISTVSLIFNKIIFRKFFLQKVTNGTAKVTIDEDTKLVTEGQSVYVPLGAVHRMENPGKLPMVLIEVQIGTYLGEDDIIRYEDLYARP